MKKSNYIFYFFLGLFTLMFFGVNAQQTNEDTYIINQYFQQSRDALLLENKVPLSTNIESQGNFLNLNQVGTNNVIDIKQKGNESQTVEQLGNKNYYGFINYYNNMSSNLNIIQQGNSNNLQIYGQNSIIENMSIVQKSNFKTIIIKNY